MLRKFLQCAAVTFAMPALALDGEILIHDPSTVIEDAGHYYTYGTGNGLPVLMSEDGWTWKRAGSLMSATPAGKAGPEVLARGGSNTWAPDIIHLGDKFFVYYSANDSAQGGPSRRSVVSRFRVSPTNPRQADPKSGAVPALRRVA